MKAGAPSRSVMLRPNVFSLSHTSRTSLPSCGRSSPFVLVEFSAAHICYESLKPQSYIKLQRMATARCLGRSVSACRGRSVMNLLRYLSTRRSVPESATVAETLASRMEKKRAVNRTETSVVYCFVEKLSLCSKAMRGVPSSTKTVPTGRKPNRSSRRCIGMLSRWVSARR